MCSAFVNLVNLFIAIHANYMTMIFCRLDLNELKAKIYVELIKSYNVGLGSV